MSPFHPRHPLTHAHSPSSLSHSHARVPCWNDECIFLTSIPSFPITSRSFDYSSPDLEGKGKGGDKHSALLDPFKISSLQELYYHSSSSPDLDNEDDYDLLPYSAVDSNFSTCYQPTHHQKINVGDYYGLEFVPTLVGGRGGERGGRDIIKVEIIGSENLGRIVSWDKQDDVVENGEEGWVVLTERKNGGGGWVSQDRSLSFFSILSERCFELIVVRVCIIGT